MRVTNQMMTNNFLRDMRKNLENLSTVQGQMTSGKQIRKPSDDPFKAARAMQLNSDINTNSQYKENISDTSNWLDTTDTALNNAGSVLQRIRELVVSAGNASYGSSEKKAIKDEINQNIGQIAQILNTNFDGKYIFGGTRGSVKPVTDQIDNATGNNTIGFFDSGTNGILDSSNAAGDVEINKINSRLSVEISKGVSIDYNVSAGDFLKFKNESGKALKLGDLLKGITNHLDGKDDNGTAPDATAQSKITGSDLTGVTDAISNLLKLRSEVGAKINRMESALNKNTDETGNMKEILSNTEDVDITEKTMEYANMQAVYTASLQTSARVIQPSLLDYLR